MISRRHARFATLTGLLKQFAVCANVQGITALLVSLRRTRIPATVLNPSRKSKLISMVVKIIVKINVVNAVMF